MADFWQLGLVIGLVVVNALFAGSEMALVSLRPAQIERLSGRGRAGRALARLAADPNRYLATIQIGITLANFLASAAAAVSLAEPLLPLFSAFGTSAELLAIVTVTLILTFFTLVFGELAPKRIAMQHAEGWALLVARPLNVIATLARPAVWALSISTNLVVRLTGGDPDRQTADVTEEEIRDMVSAQATFTEEQRRVISGALEVGERTLREVLVPRHRVFTLPAAMPCEEATRLVLESQHSRAPVYRENPDDVVGLVHLRDLVNRDVVNEGGTLDEVMSPIAAFPESARALLTLRDLQVARQQMAIVVDEHGSFEGIITIEDLVEEIVGEIYDEDDPDVSPLVRHPDGRIELPGSFPAHDLVDIGIETPAGSYTTVAGLILEVLGHIPTVGESVDLDGWRLQVTAMERSSIAAVEATPQAREPDED